MDCRALPFPEYWRNKLDKLERKQCFECKLRKAIEKRLPQSKRYKRLHVLMLLLFRAPEIKQGICSRCSLQLEPGVTSSVRFRRNKSKVLFKITTCLSCKSVSRIRMDPKYEPKTTSLPAEEVD